MWPFPQEGGFILWYCLTVFAENVATGQTLLPNHTEYSVDGKELSTFIYR